MRLAPHALLNLLVIFTIPFSLASDKVLSVSTTLLAYLHRAEFNWVLGSSAVMSPATLSHLEHDCLKCVLSLNRDRVII